MKRVTAPKDDRQVRHVHKLNGLRRPPSAARSSLSWRTISSRVVRRGADVMKPYMGGTKTSSRRGGGNFDGARESEKLSGRDRLFRYLSYLRRMDMRIP